MTLILAYSAVLFSFASGVIALLTNQRSKLLAICQFCFNKLPDKQQAWAPRVYACFEEQQFPPLLRLAVFGLLGLSGIFAVLAGLSVLIGNGVITDQINLGLPWLPWHVRFDALSNVRVIRFNGRKEYNELKKEAQE